MMQCFGTCLLWYYRVISFTLQNYLAFFALELMQKHPHWTFCYYFSLIWNLLLKCGLWIACVFRIPRFAALSGGTVMSTIFGAWSAYFHCNSTTFSLNWSNPALILSWALQESLFSLACSEWAKQYLLLILIFKSVFSLLSSSTYSCQTMQNAALCSNRVFARSLAFLQLE